MGSVNEVDPSPPSSGREINRRPIAMPPLISPEFDRNQPGSLPHGLCLEVRISKSVAFSGSMELMDVPKKGFELLWHLGSARIKGF